jgi:hypothetical protein
MNSKNIGIVLKIDGALTLLSGVVTLIFYRPLNAFTGLPDITPTLYPRTLGALMIGLGYILWMAARDPNGNLQTILGGIIGRVLGAVVVFYQIFISQIVLPQPLGLPPFSLALANVVMLVLIVLEAIYWWSKRSQAKAA